MDYTNKKIDDQLLKILMRELADETFKEAQLIAPNSSGNLKKTGVIKYLNKGFRITYTAPYAYNIHEGKSENLTTPHVSEIPSHKRKLPTKTVRVKAHEKTYKTIGEKPVYMEGVSKKQFRKGPTSPNWITKNVNLPREKNEWVQKAWTKVISKLPKELRKDYLPKRLTVELLPF